MIYLITNAPNNFISDGSYQFGKLEDVLSWVNTHDFVPIDSETWGFDPHTQDMICLQIGDKDVQYVIDCATVDIHCFKNGLESRTLIGHNLKFDLKFLYAKGIYPRKVYDTFVAEKVLNCGLDLVRAALDEVTERYLGVTLDKSVRKDIHKEGLSNRVIKYAADDVVYLLDIVNAQAVLAKEKELTAAINLENRFTPALAYVEYCGFKLDVKRWAKKMENDEALLHAQVRKLNDWVLNKGLTQYIDQQLNMFHPQDCTINWSSPSQVAGFFTDLGIDCTVYENGKQKKSVEASVISKYRAEHEIVDLYLQYKQYEKEVTTYGANFLAQINSSTKRLHTNFKQIMDTGRISSGGGDAGSKVKTINFQNIPADPETRACFIAEPGNTLVVCDYSGQEQIVLANVSMDENLLKFYDEGLGDMHSYVASLMFPELKGLSLDEIKSKHKDKRQFAKSAGFAINYGGDGNTIATNLNIPGEQGKKIYDGYFKGFPGLKSHFDKSKQQGLNDGYILISPITQRKSYIYFYDRYQMLNAIITPSYWEEYRKHKEWGTPEFDVMRKDVKEYFKYKGEIERKSLNYPIQGQSAEITKISCIYIFDWIVTNNLFGVVKFVNTVHDENVLECPQEMADKVAKMVGTYMEKAGAFYCKRVPLKAAPEITPFWKK